MKNSNVQRLQLATGLYMTRSPKPCEEDLRATLDETLWYDAESHSQEIRSFMDSWQGARDLSCLDVFGFSGAVRKAWEARGFTAAQYDIGLNPRSDDLLSKRGYLHLTRSLSGCPDFF